MLRYQVFFRSYTFNEHLDNITGNLIAGKAEDTTTIDEVVSTPSFRDIREALHLAQGGTLGAAYKGIRYLRVSGRIIVPASGSEIDAAARLADKERALRAVLDPYLCDLESPVTDGASQLTWREDTKLVTPYGSPLPLTMWVRPTSQPTIAARLADRRTRTWSVIFAAPDPRIYIANIASLTLTPGSPTGGLTNYGTTPAPLRLAIATSSSAAAANFTITIGGKSFIVNCNGVAPGTTVFVNCDPYSGPFGRGRTILVGTTEAPDRRVSSPGSWLSVPPGNTTAQITNTSGIASCSLYWYHAWA
jgi:hypothetical protein